eukprot:jgi/Undpi1/4889/HiC_scaffold_19.g08241.m1
MSPGAVAFVLPFSVLLLASSAPKCQAFVRPSLSASRFSGCLGGNQQQLQRVRDGSNGRGAGRRRERGLARMAVSHAAAEEISNIDDVPVLKDPVTVGDFDAMDIRVGRIVVADLVPDPDHGNKPSRKFLSLVVDLGSEKRRVVSAIRSIVDVEDAIGKAVLMAANVEEETILGLPSRGRILSASNFSKEPMPRTLRTVLLGGGGVPPGSAVSGL